MLFDTVYLLNVGSGYKYLFIWQCLFHYFTPGTTGKKIMLKLPLSLRLFSTKCISIWLGGFDSVKDGSPNLAAASTLLSLESQSVFPGVGNFGCSHHSFPRTPPTVRLLFALRLRDVGLALNYDEQEASRTFKHCVCHLDICSCINFIMRAQL